MTGQQLRDVAAASKRERAHHDDNVRRGCAHSVCYCDECVTDRVIIAAAAPWLLEFVAEYRVEKGLF